MKKLFKKMFGYLKHLFTDHPNWKGESYLSHGAWALLYSVYLLLASMACFIHAIFPFLFTHTASSIAEWIIDANEHRRF